MRLKTIMPLACIGVLVFCATGCSKSDEMEVDYSMPIRLSAQGEISTANTRAVSDFPNKEIYIRGVFAKTENDYTSANWGTNKDNCYIIDAAAEPATEAGETYTFNWVIPQYWHLPGTHVVGEDDFKFLTFFAYSPATNDRFSLTKTEGDYKDIKFDMNLPALDAENKHIMQDVLSTYQVAKADRAKNTVHLGKFCHALSQVSLKLELVNVSPNIYLKELSVTLTKSGSFLHDGWLSDAGEVNAKKDPIYTYSTTSTPTDTVKYVYPITDAQLSKHATLSLYSGISDSGTSFFVLPNDPVALLTLIL